MINVLIQRKLNIRDQDYNASLNLRSTLTKDEKFNIEKGAFGNNWNQNYFVHCLDDI